MDSIKGKKDTRSREQLIQEVQRLRSRGVVDQVGMTARTIVRVACVMFVAYMFKETIKELAGRETVTNILVSFFGSLSVNVAIAWGLAAAGVAYGEYQRRLRKRTVSSWASRKAELERHIDPRRSSSGLSHDGDTHPEDKE